MAPRSFNLRRSWSVALIGNLLAGVQAQLDVSNTAGDVQSLASSIASDVQTPAALSSIASAVDNGVASISSLIDTPLAASSSAAAVLDNVGGVSSAAAGVQTPVSSIAPDAQVTISSVASSIADGAQSATTLLSSIASNVQATSKVSSVVSSAKASASSAVAAVLGPLSVSSTILIFARDASSAASASSGLQGYAIPYEIALVPIGGIDLPTLNSSSTSGNYGAIVVVGEVSYDYGGGNFRSALTDAQWKQLYDYQTAFGARMVRLDVYPGPAVGCSALGGTGVDHGVSVSNLSAILTSGLKTGASMSTAGIWHYPATITDPSTTWEVAQFGEGGGFAKSTAAVINQFGTRQQMAIFMPFPTDWSPTSNFVQHIWINWATRGLYTGFRRIYLGAQVDDMFVTTALYYPAGELFRARPGDMEAHKTWQKTLNTKLPSGSKFFVEMGHNGNGDIQASFANDTSKLCSQGPITYPYQELTPLEFQKTPGTGTNVWPTTPASYIWSKACAALDPLQQWWAKSENYNAFAHVSHTFTHAYFNNATYSDAVKEIKFNKDWMSQMGFAKSTYYSNGLIPPAITGMHNGDVIKGWMDNGVKYVVGDNTRPVLRNTASPFWPLISTKDSNGYDGLVIIPRWSSVIYYNCASTDCTLAEWINTSGGSGDINTLLASAKNSAMLRLLGLHWDPYMFHQANMRQTDVNTTTINGVTGKFSLLQIWVEIVTQELVRLTNWPIVTLKHDDIGQAFVNRMTRDGCKPKLTWTKIGSQITAATVSTNGNTCGTKIPVTFPVKVKSANGGTVEQLGSDPLTIWVDMKGSPVTFNLTSPITV